MMGVNISGALYWSPHRDDPFKLYKAFGKELQKSQSSVIDEKLQQMAVAVIRDSVANSTIEALLRDRNQLRDGIKKSMQEMMTGWGMWLETIEISDVHITSGTLFKNMQTEHREKFRLHADKIQSEATNKIREDDMEQQTKVQNLRQEVDNEGQKYRMSLESDQQLFKMKTQIQEQSAKQTYQQAKFETEKAKNAMGFEIEATKQQFENKYARKELELEEQMLTP